MIADHLCLTRETISRSLTSLREDGVLTTRNHDEIEIKDMEALRRRANGDDGPVTELRFSMPGAHMILQKQ